MLFLRDVSVVVTGGISRWNLGIIGSVQLGNAPFPRASFYAFSGSWLVLCLIGSASIGKKGHFSALPLMESDASCPECAGSAMSIKFNKLPIYHLRNLQPRALRFLSSFPSSVQRIITFIVPRLFVSALPFHRRFPLLPASPFLFHSYLASRNDDTVISEILCRMLSRMKRKITVKSRRGAATGTRVWH